MESIAKKVKFPKLEGVLASNGLSYTAVGTAHGMGAQAFGRRMNGEVEFSLDEIVWLCKFLNCSFSELFGEINF